MTDNFDKWLDQFDTNMKQGLEMLDGMREQMKMKAKLGSMELREEMEEFEKKWDVWRNKMESAGEEMEAASGDVTKAMDNLMGEMKTAFNRVRDKLDD
ncbi:MAG: hypothetical protein Alpg2KO_02150 [Alphaproteobacteria bacterium]